MMSPDMEMDRVALFLIDAENLSARETVKKIHIKSIFKNQYHTLKE